MKNNAWQIFGHDRVVTLLKNQATSGSLRHAYLLTGAEGVGRRTLALRFAQALNCSQPPAPGEFCGTCRDCRQIQAMQYPDLGLVIPEAGHQDILINQIRDLQHILSLAPYSARYRIALIPDSQRVTVQAQNALLKTLEEPQDKVIILLTVSTLERLLPTIVSRCEVLRLHPASLSDSQTYLETARGLGKPQAELIAHISGGRIGAANRMVDNPQILAHRENILDDLVNLLSAPLYERFKLAEEVSSPYEQARQKAGEILPIWLSFWRDVFIRAADADLPLVNIDFSDLVKKAADSLDEPSARELVMAHEMACHQLERNANVRLLLENLTVQWPRLSLLKQ
ncbi:MAG: ATP-binding protein [Brevefilum sp.]|jgi:DNA polymerase-3 subunit delta'